MLASEVRVRAFERGGHLLSSAGGLWSCSVCKKSFASWATVAPELCRGPPVERWIVAARSAAAPESSMRHASHRLRDTGPLTWCCQCGAYAEVCGHGLPRFCRGSSAAAAPRRTVRSDRWRLAVRGKCKKQRATVKGCTWTKRPLQKPLWAAATRLAALHAGNHPVSGLRLVKRAALLQLSDRCSAWLALEILWLPLLLLPRLRPLRLRFSLRLAVVWRRCAPGSETESLHAAALVYPRL